MTQQGKITQWHEARGFGFITPAGGGKDVFVHIKALRSGRPQIGAAVSFVLTYDEQGRPRANTAKLLQPDPTPSPGKPQRRSSTLMAFLASATFLAAIAALTEIALLPRAVLWLYLGMSTLTFLLYASDKSAAAKGEWRRAEDTLQIASLLGGWPGALFAQQLLRHKSRKLSFLVVFWLTIALNIAAMICFFTPLGADVLALLEAFGRGH